MVNIAHAFAQTNQRSAEGNNRRTGRITKIDVVNDLLTVAREIGHRPTKAEYARMGNTTTRQSAGMADSRLYGSP